MSLSLEDFDKCCRWCLIKAQELVYIFDACLHDMYLTVVSLKVERNDSYPQQVCRKCILKLSAAYNFHQTVTNSHKKLTEILVNHAAQSTLINQGTEEPIQNNQQDILLPSANNIERTAFIASDTRTIKEEQDLLDLTDFVNRESDFTENFGTYDVTLGCSELPSQTNDDYSLIPSEAEKNDVKDESVCTSGVDAPLTSIVDDQKRTCNLCQYTCAHRDEMEEHTLTHKARCKVCYRLIFKHSLKRHLHNHMQPKQFECNICQHRYTTMRGLYIHKRKLHERGQGAYLCPYCGSTFKTESSLSRHKNLHTGKNIRICAHCDKIFVTRNAIIDHLKSHESVKSYTCNICVCGFTRLSSLRKHQRRFHAADGQYNCLVCEAVFANREDLMKHRKTHRRRRCYRCKLSFKDYTSLKAHNEECPYGKTSRVDSTRRTKRPNTVKAETLTTNYCCCDCGQIHSSLESLQEHSAVCRLTVQTAALQCRMCPIVFTDAQGLVDHYSDIHRTLCMIYDPEGQGHEILLTEPLLLNNVTESPDNCGKDKRYDSRIRSKLEELLG